MELTLSQKQALKADIIAASDSQCVALEAAPTNADLAFAVAALYNLNASPDFWVFRTNVPLGEVGKTFNATELAGLTSLNTQRLQNLAAWLVVGVNPSLAAIRQFFDDVFSGAGGANTRTALAVIWRRRATRVEKLFATGGDGSSGNPATMAAEGSLNFQNVLDAMAS